MKNIEKDETLKELYSKLEEALVKWKLEDEFTTYDEFKYLKLGEYLIENYSKQTLEERGITYEDPIHTAADAFSRLTRFYAKYRTDSRVNRIYRNPTDCGYAE